ncbi:hypothetical protein [Acidiphilium sp.]|uniref:hypothetical protein n=1 Tax=Acidiphilium sp. TaxID=527 RepID=UPI00258A1E4B|nr:hypothetical protein [Acidiphilium sp.]
MNAAIIPFVGLPERTARENLEAFIERAKRLRFFTGPDAVDWASTSWDLRPFANTRGQNPAGYVLHFTNHETTVRGRRLRTAEDMAEPFLSAAKAVLASFLVDTGMATPTKMVTALRIVEKAFRDLGMVPDLCELNPEILDRAAGTIQASMKEPWSYGRALERFAHETVNPCRLAAAHLIWRSPFPYGGANRSDRVSTNTGEVEGSDKLPHLKCVLDLAGIFRDATSSADIVVTSWFALAMFSPTRANEILTLPVNCETEMEGVYGISWLPLKGGSPMTKFATNDDWAEVTRTAIGRLKELGVPARKAAAWYAENPGSLYLPEGMEHLRGEPLTTWEICRILGIEGGFNPGCTLDKTLVRLDCFTNDAEKTGGVRYRKLHEFSSVERYVTEVLPLGFPLADKRQGMKAADALFCLPRHALHSKGSSLYMNVPDLVSYSQIAHELGRKPNGTTVFSRHGLIDPRWGEPWQLRTHQPRHLLNTLAQSKHLSETLIAFWSGRKRVDHNAWYNHIPHEAFIEAYVTMGKNAPREIGVVGPLADKVEERARREMVTHDTALRLEVGSIISTRYGLCRHNYALTPCPKDKNCIGCGENTFVKGDEHQVAEARKQLGISKAAVANCLKAIADGEPDVEPWLAKHEQAAARWELALERLTDTALVDGTLITLPPPAVSQTKTGLTLAIRDAEAPAVARDEPDLETMLALGGNT